MAESKTNGRPTIIRSGAVGRENSVPVPLRPAPPPPISSRLQSFVLSPRSKFKSNRNELLAKSSTLAFSSSAKNKRQPDEQNLNITQSTNPFLQPSTDRLYPDLTSMSGAGDVIGDNFINERIEEQNSAVKSKPSPTRNKSVKKVQATAPPIKVKKSLSVDFQHRFQSPRDKRQHSKSFTCSPRHEDDVMDDNSVTGSYNLISADTESISLLGIRHISEDDNLPTDTTKPPPRPIAPPRRTTSSFRKDHEQTIIMERTITNPPENSSTVSVKGSIPLQPPVAPRRHKNIAKRTKELPNNQENRVENIQKEISLSKDSVCVNVSPTMLSDISSAPLSSDSSTTLFHVSSHAHDISETNDKSSPLILRKSSVDIDSLLEQNIRELGKTLNKKKSDPLIITTSESKQSSTSSCSSLERSRSSKNTSLVSELETLLQNKTNTSKTSISQPILSTSNVDSVSVPLIKPVPVPVRRKTILSSSSSDSPQMTPTFDFNQSCKDHIEKSSAKSNDIKHVIMPINLQKDVNDNFRDNNSTYETSHKARSCSNLSDSITDEDNDSQESPDFLLRKNSHGKLPPLRPSSGPLIQPGPPKPPRLAQVSPSTNTDERAKSVAVYNFTAGHPDELSFKASDVIILLYRVNAEWLYGSLKGKKGMFPESFVHIVKPLRKNDGDNSSIDNNKQNSARHTNSSTKRAGLCQALYDFQGENDTELSFTTGAMIQLLDHVGEEWLMGEINHKQGIFPRVFVKILENLEA